MSLVPVNLAYGDMAKTGFGMDIIGIFIVTLAIESWGMAAKVPEWARVVNATIATRNIKTSS